MNDRIKWSIPAFASFVVPFICCGVIQFKGAISKIPFKAPDGMDLPWIAVGSFLQFWVALLAGLQLARGWKKETSWWLNFICATPWCLLIVAISLLYDWLAGNTPQREVLSLATFLGIGFGPALSEQLQKPVSDAS